jgi:ankyrin repeat protein
MVRILVDYGTSVDSVNGEGQTALHIAAEIGDEAMVKYFYGVRAIELYQINILLLFRSNTYAFGSREWTRQYN